MKTKEYILENNNESKTVLAFAIGVTNISAAFIQHDLVSETSDSIGLSNEMLVKLKNIIDVVLTED